MYWDIHETDLIPLDWIYDQLFDLEKILRFMSYLYEYTISPFWNLNVCKQNLNLRLQIMYTLKLIQ